MFRPQRYYNFLKCARFYIKKTYPLPPPRYSHRHSVLLRANRGFHYVKKIRVLRFLLFFQKKVIFICVYEKILLTLQSKYVNIQN